MKTPCILSAGAMLALTAGALQTRAAVVADVDATALAVPDGTAVTNLANSGTAGEFTTIVGAPVTASQPSNNNPALTVQGVEFSGAKMKSAVSMVDAGIQGDQAFTTEGWVWNPAIAGEETIVSWGRRNGPDGTNTGFHQGTNAGFGAVGHWGGPDIGYGNGGTDINATANRWAHLAYVYDGAGNQKVYINGALSNSDVTGVALNPHQVFTDTAGDPPAPLPVHIYLGAESNPANENNTPIAFSGIIAQVKVYSQALTDGEVMDSFDAGKLLFFDGIADLTDSDGDGMPDAWETNWPGITDLSQLGPDPSDFDGDGLPDVGEFAASTNPTVPDTDGDGLRDGVETNTGTWVGASDTGTDPLDPDTDGDGLLDGVETNTGVFVSATDTGSDPHDTDSDDDTLLDGIEVANGWDPNDPASPVLPDDRGALFLDGTGDFVTFANTAGLIPSGSSVFTLEAWVNPTSGNDRHITFWGTQGPNNTANGFRLRGAAGTRHYFWGNDHDENFGLDILPDDTGPNTDGWHHLAFTFNGTESRWYWNGMQLGNTRILATIPNVVDANHRIGSRLSADYWHGFIDELRIWNVVRTPEEIADNFEFALEPNQPGLVAYWDFNKASTFSDVTGNGHDGTPMGDSKIDLLANAPVEALVTAPFQITEVTLESGSLDITWNSRPGRFYRIEWSVDAMTWSEVDDSYPSGGESTTYSYEGGIEVGPVPDPETTPLIFLRVGEVGG